MLLLDKPKQLQRVSTNLPAIYEQIVTQVKVELSYMFISDQDRHFRLYYSEEIYLESIERIVKARMYKIQNGIT